MIPVLRVLTAASLHVCILLLILNVIWLCRHYIIPLQQYHYTIILTNDGPIHALKIWNWGLLTKVYHIFCPNNSLHFTLFLLLDKRQCAIYFSKLNHSYQCWFILSQFILHDKQQCGIFFSIEMDKLTGHMLHCEILFKYWEHLVVTHWPFWFVNTHR